MAREQGTFDFSANFEVKKKGTIDARQTVDNFADLLAFTSSNFIDVAFPVTVKGIADPSEFGLYLCNDANDLSNPASWTKLGEGTGGIDQSSIVNDFTNDPNDVTKIAGANAVYTIVQNVNSINTLLQSNDTDLDTIQELVDTIKSNVAFIESIDTDGELVSTIDAAIGNTSWRTIYSSKLADIKTISTATYTVIDSDTDKILIFTVPCTVTLPNTIPTGTQFTASNESTGQVIFSGTLSSANGNELGGQYNHGTFYKKSSEWIGIVSSDGSTAPARVSTKTITATTYTVVNEDTGLILIFTQPATITLPDNLIVGTQFTAQNKSTGDLTFNAATTLNSQNGNIVVGQYSHAYFYNETATTWVGLVDAANTSSASIPEASQGIQKVETAVGSGVFEYQLGGNTISQDIIIEPVFASSYDFTLGTESDNWFDKISFAANELIFTAENSLG